ncbi:MAG: Trk system potassium transporter TrkA [Lachnospiraceae bacterium]
MRIIIVGCGELGISLTAQLSKEDNNISVIDTDYALVQEVSNIYNVFGVAGNGAVYSTLSEANIEQADLFIAVTESDELNLLCCVIAKKTGQCKTIARVRNPIYIKERRFIREELDLSMIINPEFAAAREIARLLRFPSAIEIDVFSKGYVEALRFRISPDSILCNMALSELSAKLKTEVLISAVDRDGIVTIPDGKFILHSGDMVSFVASHKNAIRFFAKIGIKTNRAKSTLIIGGGEISVYLATMLLKLGMTVKIVEKNLARCEELSDLLPGAIILHGDGGDEDLLDEERIKNTASFVALTNSDEENIMLSLVAREKTQAKIITKINHIKLSRLIGNLFLDSVVYPQHTTSEIILQYVRATKNSMGSNIETLYKLMDNRVEALEFHVLENPLLTNIPLQDLDIKSNILIACIIRDGKPIIPGGQDCLLPRDHVIVVTTRSGLQDMQDILN